MPRLDKVILDASYAIALSAPGDSFQRKQHEEEN